MPLRTHPNSTTRGDKDVGKTSYVFEYVLLCDDSKQSPVGKKKRQVLHCSSPAVECASQTRQEGSQDAPFVGDEGLPETHLPEEVNHRLHRRLINNCDRRLGKGKTRIRRSNMRNGRKQKTINGLHSRPCWSVRAAAVRYSRLTWHAPQSTPWNWRRCPSWSASMPLQIHIDQASTQHKPHGHDTSYMDRVSVWKADMTA